MCKQFCFLGPYYKTCLIQTCQEVCVCVCVKPKAKIEMSNLAIILQAMDVNLHQSFAVNILMFHTLQLFCTPPYFCLVTFLSLSFVLSYHSFFSFAISSPCVIKKQKLVFLFHFTRFLMLFLIHVAKHT